MANTEDKVTSTLLTFMVTIHSMEPKLKTKELSRAVSDLVDGWAQRNDFLSCCFETYKDDITDELEQENAATAKAEAEIAETHAS